MQGTEAEPLPSWGSSQGSAEAEGQDECRAGRRQQNDFHVALSPLGDRSLLSITALQLPFLLLA